MAKAKQAIEWKNRIVESGEMPANQYLAHDKNARRHPNKQREALRGSLNSVGWIAPVIVSARTGKLLDGHARIEEALTKDEAQPVPFVKVDVSEAEENLILASFDPITGLATYDREALDLLLRETSTGDAALQELLGELAAANELYVDPPSAGKPADAEPQIDKAKLLNKKWKVKAGDLFQIGAHRLLCGDSTKAEDVARLMGGEKANMVFTDPPYGVSYVGKTEDAMTIEGDGDADIAVKAISHIGSVGLAGMPIYICFPAEQLKALGEMWTSPRRLQSMLVWKKNSIVMGRKDYQYQHEPIWYGWLEGGAHSWHAGRDQASVWEIDRPQRNEVHPTMKPIDVPAKAIQNSSLSKGCVYEPFGGSGSTIVAAQNLNRKCYAMEISENYCAVILERMATAFPDLKIERVQE